MAVTMVAPTIVGNNVEVTQPMRDYADSKLAKPLERFKDVINSAEVHLKVEKRGVHDAEHLGREAHVAELTAHCKDRYTIHASTESDSMYASLDNLADMVTRKLRKHTERKIDNNQRSRREAKAGVVEELTRGDPDDDEVA